MVIETLTSFYKKKLAATPPIKLEYWVVLATCLMAIIATYVSYKHGYIVAYGDAESHVNIAKRVISGPRSGFAQLGGIWLPLPHLLLIPFVYFDSLWRSGLAGAIVSGISFVIASLYIYKTAYLITISKVASIIAAVVFITNPNALYMQSTALTELPLIACFVVTTYFFIQYLKKDTNLIYLIAAAFFGFCATLVRYDGWFLVFFMALTIMVKHLPWAKIPKKISDITTTFSFKAWELLQGHFVIFASLAFLGILFWLFWDFLILGDPLYFTNSEFSAKSQQNILLAAHQLPAYKNLVTSFLYYFVTTLTNIGYLIFYGSVAGFVVLLLNKKEKNRFFIAFILSTIFIFNIITLYLGQSVIFLPALNPVSIGDNVFNVRYGLMMLPFAALFFAYLYHESHKYMKFIVLLLLIAQLGIFSSHNFEIITLTDGLKGISSSAKDIAKIDASHWLRDNYDDGFVLIDDYARSISITESHVPMKNIIYIGSGPYWTESFDEPQKYAAWIVIKQSDVVWKDLYQIPKRKVALDTYFDLVYESTDRKIYKRKL